MITKTLDLGCGRTPRNPFGADELFGIDVRDDLSSNIKRADLVIEPIPFESNCFDFVTAYDFLEHIPRVVYKPERCNSFVELMNEVYRVLKPEGLFLSLTPAYPHGEAFRDPTHVNIITEETFPLYFDDINKWASMYGFFGSFKILTHLWVGPHLLSVLQKTKNAKESNVEVEGPCYEISNYNLLKTYNPSSELLQQAALRVVEVIIELKNERLKIVSSSTSNDYILYGLKIKKYIESIRTDPMFSQVISVLEEGV